MATKTILAGSRLLDAYLQQTPTSARLYSRAQQIFPSGVTHYGRYLRPHPVFISRAEASRKWDVDGNEYVDYLGGHGALLLGHNHPSVVEAVERQLRRGVHYGASHELELEWATLIHEMIPCAERVRFTVTGTEATHLALRVSRAYTGKPAILRFASHFHGWHDHVAFSAASGAPGITEGVAKNVVICPPNDLEAVRTACESRGDIAAVILEPTGATFGQIPVNRQFLSDLRDLTRRLGIVLIFDEVISGFRCSPAGAQGYYGITPDLATLAKIMAGGYPGAALVGRAEIMSVLGFSERQDGISPPVVPHQGTYNGGPISAAAGLATLKLIQSSSVIETANRTAARIRDELNAVLRRRGLGWCVYGEFSSFLIYPNPDREPVTPQDIYAGKVPWGKLKGAVPAELLHKIRVGFLCGGVDPVSWPGGVVSAVHTGDDVDRTVSAFEKLLAILAEEGDL